MVCVRHPQRAPRAACPRRPAERKRCLLRGPWLAGLVHGAGEARSGFRFSTVPVGPLCHVYCHSCTYNVDHPMVFRQQDGAVGKDRRGGWPAPYSQHSTLLILLVAAGDVLVSSPP